ncbi:hypothetical protein AU377_00325 [Sporosarcina sp. HYO08]|nr:hypothetical protein AU377_00325 [Sporosarcina sp. HYO08]
MKRKNLIITISTLTFIGLSFSVCSLSYFNNQEINLAVERCFATGGMPIIESDTFAINYSFSCETNK